MLAGDYGYVEKGDRASLLLRSVAEELKLPLMQIARQAELYNLDVTASPQAFRGIQTNADMSLALLDSYLVGLEIYEQQKILTLEPIALSGVLYDTLHALHEYAQQYNVGIELRMGRKQKLVMAHAQSLKAALFTLAYTVISTTSAPNKKQRLHFDVHETGEGIAAGMYGAYQLSMADLKRARTLYGYARQPLQGIATSSAAGIFLADVMLQAMGSELNIFHRRMQTGLGASLAVSRQLRLV